MNASEQTAVVSNKILSPEGKPLNEGDEIVLQVVKNYGDECEVKYAPHKEGEEQGEGAEPSTDNMSAEGKDFAAMDQGSY